MWQPKVVAATIALAFLLLAGLYATIVPPLEGFDALAHFGYAAFLHQERRLPTLEPATVRASYELITQPPLYFAAIALATAPLSMAEAQQFAQASDSPYHEKSLSLRQTITLPNIPPGVRWALWVARLISILGGLTTAIGAYLLLHELLPGQPRLALVVASMVGWTPQFLFTSVTITNDAWAPALSVMTLWLLARTTHPPHDRWSNWLLTGLLAGLAALTKYSCLLIAIPALFLLFRYAKSTRDWRRLLVGCLLLAVAATLVAGFWFVRYWLLYSSPLPFDQMAVALPTMRRPQPLPLTQLLSNIPWLFTSYWGVFVSIIAPPAYLSFTNWLLLGGVLGLVIGYLRTRRSPMLWADELRVALLFSLVWFLTIFAGVLHWTRTIAFGEQGRLLHAAAPALALLLLIGWQGWLPPRAWPWLQRLTPLLFLGLALWPLPTLRNNYGLPTSLTSPIAYERSIQATFAGGMRLLGADFPAGAALTPGQRLPIALYWQTDQAITEDYTLFLHLADAQDQLFYQFDGLPARGRHPTRQWLPGAAFVDRHTLSSGALSTNTLASLSVGFYPVDDLQQRQLALDANQNVIGDRVLLAPMRILAQPPLLQPTDTPALAQWQNGIRLLAVDVEHLVTGAPQAIQVRWQTATLLPTDYTLFVQVLDASNQVVAQMDAPPQAGHAPTSTWLAGEVIEDHYALPPFTGDWRRLIIGLYDAQGQRLLLANPTASDHWVILENP
jgi:4-amino-4-deoxy-L-arabinose transferase-like glycosyltransferase